MTQKNKTGKPEEKGNAREDRLKAALKANMAKRKAQARARSSEKTVTPESKG
jgi:hypothetical protein